MEDMEKQKFDDSWKDAFREAEVSPSENVWTNIELDLEKEEGGAMRRKLLFYKTLAAASVIFALAIGGTAVYVFQYNGAAGSEQMALRSEVSKKNENDRTPTQAIEETTTNAPNLHSEQEGLSPEQNSKAKKEDVVIAGTEESGKVSNEYDTPGLEEMPTKVANSQHNDALETAESVQKADQGADADHPANADNKIQRYANTIPPVSTNSEIVNNSTGDENVALVQISHTNLPSLVTTPTVAFKIPVREQQQADPVALMLAKLDQRENEIKSGKKKKDKEQASESAEDMWTSVGFAAGSFNTTTVSSISTPPATTFSQSARYNNTIATKEASASGMAYTVGINMGKKIAERWIVQGGVNYLTQSSDYTAQSAVGSPDYQSFRPESINELENLNEAADYAYSENKVITTAPYNVNNNVKYLSVPLQAGFLVIDKKFGLQMNAGISTDLFLQNTKSANAENLNKIEQGIGDNSPYRTMNFSGLLGTEFSYKFTPRYRVILNPGLRYPINSVYKSGLGIESAPLTFDVGLRFRYIFK